MCRGTVSKGVDEDYDMKDIVKRKAIANIIKLKNESFKTILFEATIVLLNVVGKFKEISEKISEMTSETTSEMGTEMVAEALLKGETKLKVIVEQYESCPENPQIGLANLIEYMKGDVNINRLFNESLESLLGIEKEDLLPFFKSFLMPNYDCITSIIHKEGFNNLIKQRITEVELKSDWDESLYDWGMIKL